MKKWFVITLLFTLVSIPMVVAMPMIAGLVIWEISAGRRIK